METPSISKMTPEQIMRKEKFKRAIPSMLLDQTGRMGTGILATGEPSDPVRYEYLSQADFVREFEVNSHAINSIQYYPNPMARDDEGKLYQKIKTRIALPFQKIVHTKRVDCLTGNNANIRLISKNDKQMELLNIFRECWEEKNIENAIYEGISSDGKLGDAAICYYVANNEVGWKLLSYDKGDILYPHYDPITGKLALFGRKYSVYNENGDKEFYLDVWDKTNYMRYKETEVSGEESGWLIDQNPIPHSFERVPIAYTRYGAPYWADAQDLINKFEFTISQLAENNMAYALRILYSFGSEMEMSATLDGTPTQIVSPDPNAKVGFLEPADSSNSFELELKVLEENIYRGSFAVKTPEIKSGSDMSSLTLKMMFADGFQKAQSDAKFYQGFLDDNVALFKYGLGIELGKTSEMAGFRVKAKLYPYVFLSETEEVANLMQLKSVGGLSKRTLCDNSYEMGYGTINEYERVLQEEHDELIGTGDVPAQSPITGGSQATRKNVVNNARIELNQN